MTKRTENDSGFSALSRAFKANPTIEHYVKLRRENPGEQIEIATSGGIDWLFANEQLLRKFRVPPELIARALDADSDAVSELSLLLMERIVEREEAEKLGQTHLASRGEAVSDSLINYLINLMLDSLDWNDDLHIPRDLIVLIRHQVGGARSEWERSLEVQQKRSNAIWIAVQMAQQGHTPSYRKIAGALGVDATTVMRWFPNNELTEKMKALTGLLELVGQKQDRS
jgi:hypothetical protein